jgi:hypothetical protein
MKWDTKLVIISMLTYFVFALFNLVGQVHGFIGPVPLTVFYVPLVAVLFLVGTKPAYNSIPLAAFAAGTIGLLLDVLGKGPGELLVKVLFVSIVAFIGGITYRAIKTKELHLGFRYLFIAFGVMILAQIIFEITNPSDPERYTAPSIFVYGVAGIAAAILIIDRSLKQLKTGEKRMFLLIVLFIYFQIVNYISVLSAMVDHVKHDLRYLN